MLDLRTALATPEILLLDGAMGTRLQSWGLPPGESPEHFCLARPDLLHTIHTDYVAAGARIISTCTFGGTRFKLGADIDVVAFNRRMAGLAREAAGDKAWVAGSVGPGGHFVEPLGALNFVELVEAFKEQIRGLEQGGADCILAETQFDLAEVRAIVLAARETTSLPVIVSMTFEQGVSLTGSTPEIFLETMQNMGVDGIGVNCSAGPLDLLGVVQTMVPLLDVPLFVYPNAGLPELVDGQTRFSLDPEGFATQMLAVAEAGAKVLGGCCGTTPEHIAALARVMAGRRVHAPASRPAASLVLTSRSRIVRVGFDQPCLLVGERINPTGKKALAAELQAGAFPLALRFAEEQIEQGARVLDVNVGAPQVQETVVLPALVKELVARYQCPLCLDSSQPEAVEAALGACPGSPLVNSISGEPGRMERLGPVCRKSGAPFILLPLRGADLPVTSAQRIAIIEDMLQQALDMGIPRRLIMVDVLALTVSSKAEAARYCLETIRYCRERLGLPAILGLSNISFGLPARELLNTTFLVMAMAEGLCACIANPSSARLRENLAAAEVLLARDARAEVFIAGYKDWRPGEAVVRAVEHRELPGTQKASGLREAVIVGDRDRICALLDAELDKGATPYDLLDTQLIPAMTEVGDKYERKEYYLPQLLLSAETMQRAFSRLRPLLELERKGQDQPVIVMATVEGDIHDIGKNIVSLMLGNHGFRVVDLGKDVPAARIAEAVQEHDARLVGLSALMTTTMVRMEDVILALRERALPVRVMVGGAVLTEAWARSIGADGYAPDAVAAVRLAKRLLDERQGVSAPAGESGE